MDVRGRLADRRGRRSDPAAPSTPDRRTSTICCSAPRTRWTGCGSWSTARNGAASELAPEVYRRAGAEVIVIGGDPDGLNINDGVGSTHLDVLRAAVVEHGADLGIAHDGDADRCLAVAADGTDVDGDAILALLALVAAATAASWSTTPSWPP